MTSTLSTTNRFFNEGKNTPLIPEDQKLFLAPTNTQDSYVIGADNPAERRLNSGRVAFSVEEVAAKLGVGRNTVYSVLNSGALTSFKIGTRRLISLAALQNFIQNMEGENIYV